MHFVPDNGTYVLVRYQHNTRVVVAFNKNTHEATLDTARFREIDQAYRRLISQYHPDRMAGAAPELREQAEAKAREINAAYDRIKTLRKRK